tara:strand:+ start:9861 stop:11255 length:1395 start_codon:yes stop_codon:yes gene_type:complete
MDRLRSFSKLSKVSKIKPTVNLVIGFIGFVLIFVFIALHLYYLPSTSGCDNTNKELSFFMYGGLTCFILLSIYIIAIDKYEHNTLAYILFFIFMLSVMIGFFKFIRCNKSNDHVSLYLKKYPFVQRIIEHYKKRSFNNIPINRCKTYHTGTYYPANDIRCDASTCKDSDSTCDMKNGAKVVDFYIASSNQSCAFQIAGGNYVSEEMLRAVLVGGARLIDIDLYTNITNSGAYPIVKSEWGQKKSLNSICFERCLEVILEEAFKRHKLNDPLFLHLNIKDYNLEMMDRAAEFIVNAFPTNILLDPSFHYERGQPITGGEGSYSELPICNFYNKVIIIVSGNCKHTKLDELVNMHTKYGTIKQARIIDWEDAKTPDNKSDFITENMTMFTIVRPNPYNLNTNPEDSWTYGCQAHLMNYGNLGNIMNLHDAFFSTTSLVMKDIILQKSREEVGETKEAVGYTQNEDS